MMVEQNKQVSITFEPTGRSVWVLPGTLVLEAAGRCGLAIDSPCGGQGTCEKCRVRFVSYPPEPNETESQVLDADEIAAGWRLACQAGVLHDTVIAIPETSLFSDRLQILTQSVAIAESVDDEPHDELPVEIVDGARNFAVAFDLGTTTLVGELLDLPSGTERGIAAAINPQVIFGDDVVSRIGKACTSPADAQELRDIVVEALNKLIDELCEKTGAQRSEIRGISFSGNTTMQHLLCGWDVVKLSQLPFEPVRYEALDVPAGELGFALAETARAYVLPVIGGFVGGDTVSGILASSITELSADGPVVMIDIGTNGEIVVAANGKLLAASAAAGPAFEGARISCGMRAANGAVEKVVIDPDGTIKCSVIGGVSPIGICGSALVDITAEMLRMKIIDSMGKIANSDELCDAPPAICQRLRKDSKNQTEFVLCSGDDSPNVTITQRDVRELQLATGALKAGVEILLKQQGLTSDDINRVLIAGGFGSFIRRQNAQRIGLIPSDIPAQRITYVGNVSLHGAKWVLVSTAARRKAESIAKTAQHIELSSDMQFQMAFAESMIFPDA
ncbi:MAG: DUF4445 domain-containing protein [Phycisphaerae bacterium]|nr:DUF4445 domain-containing protein [Phycisphaerae bacterium]